MATSGSCSTSAYNSKKWVNLNWSRTNYTNTSAECSSDIYFELYGAGESGYHYAGPIKVWINRTTGVPDFTFWADRGQLYPGTLIGSGSFKINHNSDGTGSFSVYIEAAIYSNSINCYGSDSWTLDTIPRYANFTENYVKSTGLNSITVKWNADKSVDWVQYSLNGGSWYYTSGLEYTLSGLAPNTQYSIRTRIRATNSGLWTESGYIYGTTKDIAKVSSAPNINLGDNAVINITNPSGASIKYFVETLNPTKTILERTASAGNNTIVFTQGELDTIYKRMGKSNSMTLRFGVATIGSYWHWLDRSCTLTGNQKTGHVNVNNSWKRTKRWINVNGTWKRCVRWENVNGTWKRCI